MFIKCFDTPKKKKAKLTKEKKKLVNEYNDWRAKNGLEHVDSLTAKKYKGSFKEYKPKTSSYRKNEVKSVVSLGQATCGKTSIMDRMVLDKEPEHVKEEIIAKSKRIAQMYNKGGYQYITDDVDITTIGTRSRRM